MESIPIAVIGAGPAGLALGVEARRAGIAGTVIFEKAKHPCNTVVTLYRHGKRVDPVYRKIALTPMGSLSFETRSRESFLLWMDEVVADHHLDIRFSHEVLDLHKQNGRFVITCVNGTARQAEIVVIAIGVFDKPTKPSYRIPAEVKNRVFFSLPPEPPASQKVLVVGGGDSAAEAACHLSRRNRVTLSYRRSEFFRINEPNLCTVNECCTFENLETELGVDITGIRPDGEGIAVRYNDGREISYDAIFYFLGGSTPRSFLEKAGVFYTDDRPVADFHGESNIPRLFLAGDLTAEKGSIMWAFNSAAAIVQKIIGSYADLVG
jgi:thioredoxin reductase (NADPH)